MENNNLNKLPDEKEIRVLVREMAKTDGNILYFPIRHHSPICSYFLLRIFEEYGPDCVLVEGPEDANELIGIMVSDEMEAPFAVYYSFKDKGGAVDAEDAGRDYRCYYPFLDYSPELVALKEAKKRNIPASFFDLGYAETLLETENGRGLLGDEEKINYNDDRYLAGNDYLKKLVEKAGLRSFDEFWEKYFETGCIGKDSSEFIADMLYYCALSRLQTPMQEMYADGCLAREAHMAENIKKAAKEHKKVLVVTGGFHSLALAHPEIFGTMDKEGTEKKKKLPRDDKGVYLMSYSMEAADALNGYASGMPFPAFYQSIWEGLLEEPRSASELYEGVILDQLVGVGRRVRKKEAYPSAADEISAYNMAVNLAALRGKAAAGAFELTDAVLSSFVKGEYNIATDLPMKELRKSLTGKRIGRLPSDAKLPPLVKDFEECCRGFRLDIHSAGKKQVELSIFANEKHREESAFFHRLVFLETGFADRKRGPNLKTGKDRNLIREIWEYRWSAGVVSILTENSVYGGSIEEACVSLAGRRMNKASNSVEASRLLMDIMDMGIEGSEQALERLGRLILSDGDFFSLTNAFINVNMLARLSVLYRSSLSFDDIRELLMDKLLSMLPTMSAVSDDELDKTLEAVKALYSELGNRDYLIETIKILAEKDDINAGLLGAAHGILYAAGELGGDDAGRYLAGVMSGSGARLSMTAPYLRGLFYTARDIVFSSDELLNALDNFVREADYADFLKLLPQLRLSFSYFTPREIDRIAGNVAKKYGESGSGILKRRAVDDVTFRLGSELDQLAYDRFLAEKGNGYKKG